MKFFACVVAFLFSFVVFADGEVAQPDVLDKIIAALTGISGPVLVGAAAVIELVFRLLKTDKPLSIAHVVAASARKVSDALEILANILDKILPQRIK